MLGSWRVFKGESRIMQWRIHRLATALAAAGGLAACGSAGESGLAPPSETGTLHIVTRNAPTAYVMDAAGRPSGPEHDLVAAYAGERGWDVAWQVEVSTGDVLTTLEKGGAHIAAAGLTHTTSRDARFHGAGTYQQVTEQLVCQRGSVRADAIGELPADLRIVVGEGTAYAESLEALLTGEDAPAPETDGRRGTERLLQEVAEGGVFCTVADSTIVAMNRRVFPELDVVLDLGASRELGWYSADEEIAAEAAAWMAGETGARAMADIDERYYRYIPEFDFVDMRALKRRIDSRLPDYRRYFEKAAANTGLAPDLLAALSYQESHWDPEARSPTGVRGIMMLTRRTAESLGVADRLDPAEAIDGGARYLADQRERLPEAIPEPDRSYLALAAYNVGRAHLLDARKLARDLGRDPDSWAHMREVLPLLTEPRYYRELKYGYARGHEPVHYVQRIRNYRDVIASGLER